MKSKTAVLPVVSISRWYLPCCQIKFPPNALNNFLTLSIWDCEVSMVVLPIHRSPVVDPYNVISASHKFATTAKELESSPAPDDHSSPPSISVSGIPQP